MAGIQASGLFTDLIWAMQSERRIFSLRFFSFLKAYFKTVFFMVDITEFFLNDFFRIVVVSIINYCLFLFLIFIFFSVFLHSFFFYYLFIFLYFISFHICLNDLFLFCKDSKTEIANNFERFFFMIVVKLT